MNFNKNNYTAFKQLALFVLTVRQKCELLEPTTDMSDLH